MHRFWSVEETFKTLKSDLDIRPVHNQKAPLGIRYSGARQPYRLLHKDGKCGYLNVNTGEIVIPAQYSKAWQSSEGLGAVLGVGNRIGFIDKDNNMAIVYEIPYNKGLDYIFKDGYCVIFASSAHLPLNLRKRNQQERAQILPDEDPEETPYR